MYYLYKLPLMSIEICYGNILIDFMRFLCLKASYWQLVSGLIMIFLLLHHRVKIGKFKVGTNVFEIQSEPNSSILEFTMIDPTANKSWMLRTQRDVKTRSKTQLLNRKSCTLALLLLLCSLMRIEDFKRVFVTRKLSNLDN